jgi:hypothetical protein
MSDQKEAGAVTSLEEVFLSREFGRLPSRGISSVRFTDEVAEPPQLEQVFLSREFGHPEAVTATTPALVAPVPALAVLPGRAERDNTRYRAIAAVSGVAAAALVVVGIAAGTGQPTKQPTVSAQGPHGSNPIGGGGSPQGTTPTPGSPGVTPTAAAGGSGSGSGTPVAQLTSATTPTSPEVVVEVPAGTTVEVVSTPPAQAAPTGTGSGSGGPPPPPVSGGGSVLTPLLVVVGNTVSTVGATVTATSTDLGHALPVASSVTGLLGGLGATVVSLGRSVVGTAT